MPVRLLMVVLSMAVSAQATRAGDDDDYGQTDAGMATLGMRAYPAPLHALAREGLEPGQGLVVVRVRPGGAAEQMGIRPGDVILAVNGATTATRLDLRNEVLAHRPGDAVRVTVSRDGVRSAVDGELGQRRSHRPPRPIDPARDEAFIADQRRQWEETSAALAGLVDDLRGAQGALGEGVGGSGGGVPAMPPVPWAFRFGLDSRPGDDAVIPPGSAPSASAAGSSRAVPPTAHPWRLTIALGTAEDG